MSVAEACGRVNLIGEHTDYNGGYVLPTAVPQRTRVKVVARSDRFVEAESRTLATKARFELGLEKSHGDWSDYVAGVTWCLRREGFELGGFDVSIESSVPLGSGLSSSAALLVALFRAINELFRLGLDNTRIAQLCQLVENSFVGARVGVMDPMACSFCRPGVALFLDTRHMTYEQVPLPIDAMELGVIHSGIHHRNASGGYNERRAQCEAAAKMMGISELRDLENSDLARLEELPENLRRRARHVVTENARVLAAVSSLKKGEIREVGRLFSESHKSMRDDYEVSTPEIDLLVQLLEKTSGVFGARLTGGGFGGSVVFIAERGAALKAAQSVIPEYDSRTGQRASLLPIKDL